MSTKREEIGPSDGRNDSRTNNRLSADLELATELRQQDLAKTQTTLLKVSNDDNFDSNSNQSTPNSSQQNSPAKSTPSKSAKNKRKNDAKKRNANLRKQQQAAVSDSGGKSVTNVGENKMSSFDDTNLQQHQIIPTSSSNPNDSKPHPKDKSAINNSSNILPTKQKSDNTPIDIDNSNQESQSQQSNDNQATILVTDKNKHVYSSSSGQSSQKITIDSSVWNRKQRENRELKEQLKLRDAQMQNFADKIKQQIVKIKELESSLVTTARTCNQYEKLLQQELTNRTRMESEQESLNQTLTRLKNQICVFEKDKVTSNELIRTLNATLMERETEVSILKLKMTRLQTSQSTKAHTALPSLPTLNYTSSSTSISGRCDPAKAYTSSGRSNSEFSRNSYARSSMIAEAAVSMRSSTSQLHHTSANDKDASVWAKVPEELTPSRRPLLLDRSLASSSKYSDQEYNTMHDHLSPRGQTSTPLSRDNRTYKTLPRSMRSPEVLISNQAPSHDAAPVDPSRRAITEVQPDNMNQKHNSNQCLVTNLDESNSTSQSSGGNKTTDAIIIDNKNNSTITNTKLSNEMPTKATDILDNHTISNSNLDTSKSVARKVDDVPQAAKTNLSPSILATRSPSTPVKISSGIKKIFNVFRRSDSSTESELQSKFDARVSPLEVPTTPTSGPFQRGANRSTLVGLPGIARGASRQDFHTDKPFAEWDTDVLVDWLTTIGLSMYANQCRRWVKCGAHIMNATPAEVDKGLGITNHLHRKKLRLAISELNGDCDKITKAAAKLDYLWVARWLDDIGLPQHKEAFINARVDGRVLNYLTVEDLLSMGVKCQLHHSSIKCGIKVLRSINFDLQLLKRRATAEEADQMTSMRQQLDDATMNSMSASSGQDESKERSNAKTNNILLWSCHRVMEWLRMINFAEFAPNLRGSGVHGGLIVYEDGFTIDTMSSLLGIPNSKTLLLRHLATFFDNLIGTDLVQRKRQYKSLTSNEPLDPKTNLKTPKKSPLWFRKLASSKVGQDGTDEYLCPMYPVEPSIIKSPSKRKAESNQREGCSQLPRIPESINV